MDKRVPGVLETLTSNKKMVFGIVSLLFALLLAFSGVYRKSGTIERQGMVATGELVGIKKRGKIDSGILRLSSSGKHQNKSFKVLLFGGEGKRLKVKKILAGETIEVKIGSQISSFELVGGSGEARYEYSLDYSYQPLRWFSVLAAVFTVIGVIAVYRGFNQFMHKFAERRIKEEEGGGGNSEEGSHVDFMGSGDVKEDNE